MNLVYFNLKDVEKKAVEQWKAQNPEINLEVTDKDLSLETKDMLIGKDAIIISQIKEIDDEVYKFAKEQGVKVLSTRSAGFDMYNKALLKKLGMKLTNVPSYSPNAIAEHTVCAALQISRNTAKIRKNVEKYNFTWASDLICREIRTLTVGIIGTGRIGTQAARLFKGLGAKVIGYDLYPNDAAKEVLTYVDSIEKLASQSDILSLHLPGLPEYTHVINDELISKMPDGAIILNSGRGNLVDTKAVLRALDSGKLLGAGLDVYENESKFITKDFSKEGDIDDEVLKELIKRDDVIFTPHTAYFSETAVENLVQGALNSAKNVVKSGNDDCLVKY